MTTFQPYSGSAVCALHPDRPASATCERCGNFTCAECNQGGYCPSCRELGAGAFPLSRNDWDFSRLWNHTWGVFKADWVILSVVALVLFGVSMVIGVIGQGVQVPLQKAGNITGVVIAMVATQLVSMVVQGLVQMGALRIFMDVLGGGKADLARISSQLPKLGTLILQQLIVIVLFGVPIGAYAGAFVGLGLSFGGAEESTILIALGLGGLLLLVPLFYFGIPLTFAAMEIVHNDGVTAIQSIKNCYAIARGQRLYTVGVALAAGGVGLVGLFACCIGLLPAWSLGQMLLAGLYLTLRNGSGVPLAAQGGPLMPPGARST